MSRQDAPSGGSFGYLLFCCFASALGGLLFGYDLFVISGTKDLIKAHFDLDLFGRWLFTVSGTMGFMDPEFNFAGFAEGLFVSSAMIGALIGCLVAGAGSDRFGRKKTLLLAAVLLLACSIGCGVAWSVGSLVFFRWIGGVGVGISSMVCPVYISEISPPGLRGRMVTLFQLAICVGIVAALVINTGLMAWHDAIKGAGAEGIIGSAVGADVWRSMLGMEALPSLVFLAMCLAIPESPRWLAKNQRNAEALAVLQRVNGEAAGAAELQEISAAIAEESDSLKELFRPGLRRALLLALFLAVISEFSGITTIWNYGPEIIRSGGIELKNELIGIIIIASTLSVFTLVAVWLMDHAGRRPLLFWGNLGCFFSLLWLGSLLGHEDASSAMKVTAAAIFVGCFAFSMGPIKWVFMSEVFPARIRGRAVAISSLAVWAADVVVSLLFPMVRDAWGKHITFYVFAAFLVPQFFFVWLMMPETKGRTLEEIERSWTAKPK